MWFKKHSRILVLIGWSFACVALAFWVITTRHYRLPLLVFIGSVVGLTLIFRKLPPPTWDPEEINNKLLKASTSVRRLGFLCIVGFAAAVFGLFSGEFKELPIWGVALMFAWGGFGIWACFRGAKWYKEKAGAARQGINEEVK